jgi:hypothetical protein
MGAVVLEQPSMLMKLLAQMEAFNAYGGSCYALPRSDGWTGSWTGLVGSARRRDATLRCRGSTRKAENWTEHDGQVQEAEPGRVGCRVMLRRPEISPTRSDVRLAQSLYSSSAPTATGSTACDVSVPKRTEDSGKLETYDLGAGYMAQRAVLKDGLGRLLVMSPGRLPRGTDRATACLGIY